jgi:hypothetical protein
MLNLDAISPDKRNLVSALVKEAEDEMPKTCLHEGIHVLYSRRLGFNPDVTGPELLERNGLPWFRLASVQGLPPKFQAEGEPVAVAKVFLAPFVLGFGNTDADLDNFTIWCAARFPDSTATEEKLFLDQVIDSIQTDIEDPDFQTELQATVAEVREVLLEKQQTV